MYDEILFDRHIFLLKAKRVFWLIFSSIIGCIIGIVASTYVIEIVMLSDNTRLPIIAGTTLFSFFIALLSTSKIKKEIKNEYWKFEVLKNLSIISKRLETLESQNGIKNQHHSKQVRFTKVLK